MNCDTIQNRILALAVATEPTAEVREHVDGCSACQAMLSKVVRLDRLLARLPVPTSEVAKDAFLEQIVADGPVIRSKPVPLSSVGSGTFPNFEKLFKFASPKILAGLAAGVMVTIGGVWVVTRTKPAQIESELAMKPRHELLARSVKHHVALSQSRTAPERLTIFTNWSADVTAEAKDVYKAANRDEISKIAALYESTVSQGILEQAKKLDDAQPDQIEHLRATIEMLNATAVETKNLAAFAPPDAQTALMRMADAAVKAQTSLQTRIAKRGA